MVTCSGEFAVRSSLLRLANELRRGEYFAGLFILGCANGLASRVIQSVNRLGWEDALTNTFEISAIVWIACISGVSLVIHDRTTGIGFRELALGVAVVLLVILPIGPLSWIAVTGLSLYILGFTRCAISRRGAFILLAATVPMLWSRILFQFFASSILQADASLVSWLLGAHRTGAVVEFADRSGAARDFAVLFITCKRISCTSLLGYPESTSAPQKVRLRCLLVPPGLCFSGCGKRCTNSHFRVEPMALHYFP